MFNKAELFYEINEHICQDDKPSLYFNSLNTPIFAQHPFTMLSGLKDIKQSPKYHPEGSVWNHTLLVLDKAADRKSQASNRQVFMWAALLHDIGKAVTTKVRKGKITAYGHDIKGAEMSKSFLLNFTSEEFTHNVSALVRWHMQVLYLSKSQHHADLASMLLETNVHDVALLGLCDRLGRIGVDQHKEERNIINFLKEVSLIN